MAKKGEDEEDSGDTSSWWSSFYDSAKLKLAETNEFMLRDMKEFTQTVKNDTSKLVADTASSMKEQLNLQSSLDEASQATKLVANSISGFLGTVVKQVSPLEPDEDESRSSVLYLVNDGGKIISPAEARLHALQTSPGTFCNEPDNAVEFDLWLKTFDLEEKKEELSSLMLDSVEVRSLYGKLVPEAVSHVDFWTRYFYKRNELEKAELRRVSIMERAVTKDTELTWDDEDDFDIVDYPDTLGSGTDKAADEQDSSEESAVVIDEAFEDEKLKDFASHNNKITLTPAPDTIAVDKTLVTPTDDTVINVNSAPENLPNIAPSADPELPKTTPPAEDTLTVVEESSKNIETEKEDQKSSHDDDDGDDIAAGRSNDDIELDSTEDKDDHSAASSATFSGSDEKDASSLKVVVSSLSGDSSDWEKEFDLEMTEEEIKEALLEDDKELHDEIEEWEQWE